MDAPSKPELQDPKEQLAELFRRVTALERLVINELKEEIVDLDDRVDTLTSGISELNQRVDRLTNTLTAVSLMTGGIERSVVKLSGLLEAYVAHVAALRADAEQRHDELLAEIRKSRA